MQNNTKTYDVIIIGAGIGGLVCGCYLARAGMRVLIIEQHDKPGGYCTSFIKKGFTFDAAAHSLGGLGQGKDFRKILTELGIDNILGITRLDPSDIVIAPDCKIAFWNDLNKTMADLTTAFPKEKENINNYFNYFPKLASANKYEHVKLRDKTFDFFLKSFFSDSTLISAISCPLFGYAGLPPSLMHAFTGAFFFYQTLMDGGYYLEGGMQTLPDALSQVIVQNHGTLLYKTLVKKILCTNNTVTGVELSDHKTYTSKYVVSACDITQTFESLLGRDCVGKNLVDKLNNFTPSISSFILYIGLDKAFDELPAPGTNIWYLPNHDLDKIHNYVMQSEVKNFAGGGFMFRVSPDKKTILAFRNAAFKTRLFWKQNKKKIAENFLNDIARFIPNLKKHIAYFDAATPETLYRYTLNYKGANYGWEPSPSQLFDTDFRQKTFIKGLYLAGHWTAQTHGIPGVAYVGYSTAKLILQREQRRIN